MDHLNKEVLQNFHMKVIPYLYRLRKNKVCFVVYSITALKMRNVVDDSFCCMDYLSFKYRLEVFLSEVFLTTDIWKCKIKSYSFLSIKCGANRWMNQCLLFRYMTIYE